MTGAEAVRLVRRIEGLRISVAEALDAAALSGSDLSVVYYLGEAQTKLAMAVHFQRQQAGRILADEALSC